MEQYNREEEDLRRRLSTLLLESAVSARRNTLSKIKRLCGERIQKLLNTESVFYHDQPGAPKVIRIRRKYEDFFNDVEFYKHPMRWIESQKPLLEDYRGRDKIIDLQSTGYDYTKLRTVQLIDENQMPLEVIIKRVNRDVTEITRTKKAVKRGLPTVTVVGTVRDRGNYYLLMKRVKAINLEALSERGYKLDRITDDSILTNYQPQSKADDLLKKLLMRIKENSEFFESILSNLMKLIIKTQMSVIDRIAINEGEVEKIKDQLDCLLKAGLSFNKPIFDTLGSVFAGVFNENNLLKLYAAIQDYQRKYLAKVNYEKRKCKLIYGRDLTKALEKLEEKIADSGLQHDDFELRNVMMSWDFTLNQPKKDKSGKVKLTVIDWERMNEENY